MPLAPAHYTVPAIATVSLLAAAVDLWAQRAFGGPLPRTMHPAWKWQVSSLCAQQQQGNTRCLSTTHQKHHVCRLQCEALLRLQQVLM